MGDILKTVAEFYQRALHGSDVRGMDFLRGEGITSAEALKAFGVGYASGGLTKALPKQELPTLQAAGLADKFGRNRHKQCITFALTDLEGEVRDLLGMAMGQNRNCKAIRDEAHGIGHAKALRATDEVLVSNYPMVCLKLFQAGHRNVLLVPDVHAAKLFQARMVTVVSPVHPEALAEHIQAEEIWTAHVNVKHKCPSQALRLAKVFKESHAKVVVPVSLSQAETGSILDRVVADLDRLGHVGEACNKRLAYLVAISRKLPRPLSAIIVSSSGAGKTGLMNAIGELVPPEDKLFLSRLTPQALYYMPQDALQGRLLVVDERNGSSMADYSIRTMQTSQTLTLARPGKQKGGGDAIRTVQVRCAYMESTVSEAINPENASRCFVLHLDESPAATEAILRAQRSSRSRGNSAGAEVIQWHHEHQRSLRGYPVAIPWAEHIGFPCHRVGFRREQQKFLSLIEASALLHQADRQIVDGVIQAGLDDYRVAHDLFAHVFADMEREVSRNAQTILVVLEKHQVQTFTMREALTLSGWPYSMVYRTVQELLRYEYIAQDHAKRGGTRKTFTLLDFHRYGRSVDRLLRPAELSTLYSRTIHGLSTDYSPSAATDFRNNGAVLKQVEAPTIQNTETKAS